MAYCTNSDVKLEFKGLEYVSSNGIASSTVDAWIAESDAYIDARLGLKYEVPLTDSGSLSIVKSISIWLTADRVKKTLTTLTGNGKGEQSSEHKESYLKMAENRIQMILEDKILLSGATLARANDGVNSYVYENDFEPTFTRDDDQW